MDKYFLSLDLGVTTGWAVLSFDPTYPKGGTVVHAYGEASENDLKNTLKHLLHNWRISYSVAEKPVVFRGPLGDQLQRVIDTTSHELMRQVEFVDPASWKATPYKKHPTPKKISPHIRDAIRLGFWYAHKLQSER